MVLLLSQFWLGGKSTQDRIKKLTYVRGIFAEGRGLFDLPLKMDEIFAGEGVEL